MKRLVLHIGIGKTGTSALQRALSENADALSAAGVWYPEAGRTPGAEAHHWLAPVGREAFPRQIRDDFIAVLDEFRASDEEMMILSSEGFCFCTENLVADIGRLAAGFEVRVVFLARPQTSLIRSAWLEKLKAGVAVPRDLPAYIVESATERAFYFTDRIASWVKAFGTEAMRCAIYRPQDISVAEQFQGLIGHALPLSTVRQVNESLSPALVKLLDEFERRAPNSPARSKFVEALVEASCDVAEVDPDPLIMRTIHEIYSADNEEYCRLFSLDPVFLNGAAL